MRRKSLVALLAVLALIAAACSDDADPATDTTQATTSGAPTTTQATDAGNTTTTTAAATTTAAPVDNRSDVQLNFTMWAAGPTLDAWQELANGYSAVDPRVSTISFEFVPFPRYHDVLNVRLSSGEVQNGGWLFVNLAPRYINAGVLTDLEPVFGATDGYEIDQIGDPALEQWRDEAGNGVYAYPFAQSPQVVFWNKDAFAAAGVKTPQELVDESNWTYETLRETALAMQQSGVVERGFAYQVDFFAEALGWRNLDNFYSAYRARPWSEDGRTCMMNSAEMVQAFQLVHDMIFLDGSMRGPGEANPSFFAGQAAMGMMHNAAAQAQAEGTEFAYGLVPQPSGPNGWQPMANTSGFVVYQDAPNADIAAEFVAWLTNPENAKVIAQFHSSPRVNILEPATLTQGLAITEEEAQAAILDALEVAWRGPAHSNWAALDREIQRIVGSELWSPDVDVQGVMNSVCDSIGELLLG